MTKLTIALPYKLTKALDAIGTEIRIKKYENHVVSLTDLRVRPKDPRLLHPSAPYGF